MEEIIYTDASFVFIYNFFQSHQIVFLDWIKITKLVSGLSLIFKKEY